MLEPIELPQDYAVLLLLPQGAVKRSTADVYAAFDARDGATGYAEREAALALRSRRARRPRSAPAERPRELAARRASSAPRARSVQTSAAPARWSTGSSTTARRGACRGRVARPRATSGSRDQRGTVDRHVRQPRDRARIDAYRALASRAPLPVHALDRHGRGPALRLARAPLVGRRPARAHRRRVLVVRRHAATAPTRCGRRGWIFAVSQLLVLCVPLGLAVLKAVAFGVIALLAIAALIFLFTERP